MSKKFTSQQVKHVAQLAQIPVSQQEAEKLAKGFSEVLELVDTLQNVDVRGVEPTHQVTGLENILREDEVVEANMFSQEEALSNASKTHKGFFVVERLIDDK